ncbi:hypothetical protein BDR26DRAFT_927388 [Obelidium mucronatum]|nr:hypothetical protein BDR26DRAFT_927388 [Obelidium mucronatum]
MSSFLQRWLSPSQQPSSPTASSPSPPPPINVTAPVLRPRALSNNILLTNSSRSESPLLSRSASPSRLAALASSVKGLFHSNSSSSLRTEVSSEEELVEDEEKPANPPASSASSSNTLTKSASLPVVSRINVVSIHSPATNNTNSPTSASSSTSSIDLEDVAAAPAETLAQQQRFSLSSIPARILNPLSNLISSAGSSPRSTPTPPDEENAENSPRSISNAAVEVAAAVDIAELTTPSAASSNNNFSSSPLSKIAFADSCSVSANNSDDSSLSESSALVPTAVETAPTAAEDSVLVQSESLPVIIVETEEAHLPVVEVARDVVEIDQTKDILVPEETIDILLPKEAKNSGVCDSEAHIADGPLVNVIPISEIGLDISPISTTPVDVAESIVISTPVLSSISAPNESMEDGQPATSPPPSTLIVSIESSSTEVEEKRIQCSLQDAMETSTFVPSSAETLTATTSVAEAVASAAESTSITDYHSVALKNIKESEVTPIDEKSPSMSNQTPVVENIKPLQFRKKPTAEERKRMTRLILEQCRPLFFPTSGDHNESSQQFQPAVDHMTLSVVSTASNSSAPVMTTSTPASTALSKQFKRTEFGDVVALTGLPKHIGFAVHRRIVERGWMQVEALREAMEDDSIASSNGQGPEEEVVSWDGFEKFITHVYQHLNPDMEALVFDLLKPSSRDYIEASDFRIVVEDILQTHAAFEFLASSPAFQARFTETVISRLFYLYPRNGRNRLNLREFRLTGITDIFHQVTTATNSLGTNIPSVFSYKDFYVIYCKFWELDRDRDMMLTIYDLELYGRRALSHAALARIIECYGVNAPDGVTIEGVVGGQRRGDNIRCLGYKEFIAFIISAEEKTSDSALDYWFRILDLDGDGVLSMLELETFWEHQHMRLPEQYSVFDFFSLILDLIRPKATSLTLMDLKRNRLAAGLFLDLLLDSRKHVENIRRSTDVGFRLRDEIWTEEEESAAAARREEEGIMGTDAEGEVGVELLLDLENVVRRYKLEGWAKFSERAYRELSAPVETDSTDEVELEDDEPVIDNSPSLQTANMNV